jgi:hypothetical protein
MANASYFFSFDFGVGCPQLHFQSTCMNDGYARHHAEQWGKHIGPAVREITVFREDDDGNVHHIVTLKPEVTFRSKS